jgi:hypothetical protein
MTVLYLVSEGVPERAAILGEMPLARCIAEFGLDPAQRVHGLREAAAPFTGRDHDPAGNDGGHVVAGVGAEEAVGDFTPGYYWLEVTPDEARRRLERG